MVMTTTALTSSNGSPCSKTCTKSSTTMTWTAKSDSSAKSWGNPNTMAPWPKSSRADSSKFYTTYFIMKLGSKMYYSIDTPSTWKSCPFPTTWGNSLTNTWMPTAVLSNRRSALNSSNAPTPSRTPSTRTACKKVHKNATHKTQTLLRDPPPEAVT